MNIKTMTNKELESLKQDAQERYQELKSTRATTIKGAGLNAYRMKACRGIIADVDVELGLRTLAKKNKATEQKNKEAA